MRSAESWEKAQWMETALIDWGSFQIPFPTQLAIKQLQRTIRLPWAFTHPHAAGLGSSRAEVPPCGFGDCPLLSKGTQSLQSGLPVLHYHWDQADPSVPGMFRPHPGEPCRQQGALSTCSAKNTHFPRRGPGKSNRSPGKSNPETTKAVWLASTQGSIPQGGQ